VELREKNISWVFLVGESAHKLKTPLVRDFLDDGTPERGRVMCEERNCASTAGWPRTSISGSAASRSARRGLS
jgi:hypothetical protein